MSIVKGVSWNEEEDVQMHEAVRAWQVQKIPHSSFVYSLVSGQRETLEVTRQVGKKKVVCQVGLVGRKESAHSLNV